MPDVLHQSFDHETREDLLLIEETKHRKHQVGYALRPQKIEMTSDEGKLRFNFSYPIYEEKGREIQLSDCNGRLICGKSSDKVLQVILDDFKPENLKTHLLGVDRALTDLAETQEPQSLAQNYKIAASFFADMRGEIARSVNVLLGSN